MNIKKLSLIYLLTACVGALGLAAFRTVIIMNEFDKEIMSYPELGNARYSLFGWILLVFSLLLVAFYFVLKKTTITADENRNLTLPDIFSGIFCGSMLIFALLVAIVIFGRTLYSKEQNAFYNVAMVLTLLLTAGAGLYFLMSSTSKYKDKKATTALSFFPSATALVYMITSYFNGDYPYNNPDRIMCNIAYGIMAISFLFIIRNRIGMTSRIFEFIIKSLSVAFGIIFYLPYIIASFGGVLTFTMSSVYEISFIGLIVYNAFSLVKLYKGIGPLEEAIPQE